MVNPVLNGVLIVDKPVGPTSHDVVDRVRRTLDVSRAGHTGTLDPFASGVLPVCLGKATRLARFFSGHDKAYEATVRLGFATTTDDHLGEPLAPPVPASLDRSTIVEAARRLTGEVLQVPPTFSAKRTAGRRHYDLARAGKTVERTPCRVTIHALEILAVHEDRVALTVRCSAGTYVRALARDLGEGLGVGGHLVALRRTHSGPFELGQAVALADVGEEGTPERVLPMGALLPEVPAVTVGESGLAALRHGRDLRRDAVLSGFPETPPARLRVLDASGALVALVVPKGFGPAVPGLPLEPVLHPDIVLLD